MPSLLSLLTGPRRRTLSVAESLTGGLIQAAVTRASGVSAFFEGGVTAYSLRQKTVLLGVNAGHAKRVNCVSPRVAREMARGVAKLFASDIGLATTGYAEASSEHGIDFPVAYWAIYVRSLGVVAEGKVDGDGLSRAQMQKRVSSRVLATLLDWLAANR